MFLFCFHHSTYATPVCLLHCYILWTFLNIDPMHFPCIVLANVLFGDKLFRFCCHIQLVLYFGGCSLILVFSSWVIFLIFMLLPLNFFYVQFPLFIRTLVSFGETRDGSLTDSVQFLDSLLKCALCFSLEFLYISCNR